MKFTSLIICISLIIGLSYVSAEQANQADDQKNGILDTVRNFEQTFLKY